MTRIVNVFKISSFLLAIALLSLIIIYVKPDVWRIEAFPTILYDSGSLIRYGFSLINYYSAISFITLFSLLTASFNSDLSQALTQLSSDYYNAIWGAQPIAPPSLISVLIDLYYLSFQILLAVILLSLVLFVFRSRLKYVFIIFLGLNSIILLAALLGNSLIGLTSLTGNPLIFILNPIFLLTILSYYYLEVSFTYVHVNELFKENIKVKEEIFEKLVDVKSNTGDRRKVKAGDRIDVFKLSAFIEKLEHEKPSFKELISGEFIIPDERKLIRDFIIKSLLRAGLILILVFICVNPSPLLTLISPIALIESVEFITPEITIILLMPLALLFPMLSLIIEYRKRNSKH